MVRMNNERNPILPTGIKAFDLRAENNNLCGFGQKSTMTIETPVRFGGELVMQFYRSLYIF